MLRLLKFKRVQLIIMKPKTLKKPKREVGDITQPDSKSININISCNITMSKNIKPALNRDINKSDNDQRFAKPKDLTVTTHKLKSNKLVNELKDQIKPRRPVLSSLSKSLTVKQTKQSKRKKSIVEESNIFQKGRITKLKTQEARVSRIYEQFVSRHRKDSSKDKVQNQKAKSSGHSRRNKSDGSRDFGQQISKQLKKQRIKRRNKRQKSCEVQDRNFSKYNTKQENQIQIDKRRKRRKTEQTPVVSRLSRSPKQNNLDTYASQDLAERLIRTEISPVHMEVNYIDSYHNAIKFKKNINPKSFTETLIEPKQQQNSFKLFKHKRPLLTQKLKQEAAKKIQAAWRNFKKSKLISYYTTIFDKNTSLLKSQKLDTHKIAKPFAKQRIKINNIQMNQCQNWEQQCSRSRQISQQSSQFQFNIRKYQDNICQLPKQDTASNSQISKFKQHQLEQWNKINLIISEKIGNKEQHEKLLQQLIKLSETNKKWIQQQHPGQKVKTQSGSIKSYKRDEPIIQSVEQKQQVKQQKDVLNLPLQKAGVPLLQSITPKSDDIFNEYLDCGLETFESIYEKDRVVSKPTILPQDDEDISEDDDELAQQDNILKIKPMFNQSRDYNQQLIKPIKSESESLYNSIEKDNIQRKCLFSKQAVFESIVEAELILACRDLLNIRCISNRIFPPKQKIFKFSNLKKNNCIKTGIEQIQDYLSSLIIYLFKSVQKTAIYKILRNINTPMGPTSKQTLEFLSIREICESGSSSMSQIDESREHVISMEIFHHFEATRLKLTQLSSKAQCYAFDWHQCLFQSLNQYLDEFRPYSVFGKPYAWEVGWRIRERHTNISTLRLALQQAASKTIQNSTQVAGIIFDKQDSPFTNEYLRFEARKEVNEERLIKMLQQTLLEQQPYFINYKDELVELQIEFSYGITDFLLREASVQIYRIMRQRIF